MKDSIHQQRGEGSADARPHGRASDILQLGIPGFSYADLYDPARLGDLLRAFDDDLRQADGELFAAYAAYRRSQGDDLTPPQRSDLLVRLAPHVGDFVARLFGVEKARSLQAGRVQQEVDTIFNFRQGVVAIARKKYKDADMQHWDLPRLEQQLELLTQIIAPDSLPNVDPEFAAAHVGTTLYRLCARLESVDDLAKAPRLERELKLLRDRLTSVARGRRLFSTALKQKDPAKFAEDLLDVVHRWCGVAHAVPHLKRKVAGWISFKEAKKTDFQDLVPCVERQQDGYSTLLGLPEDHRRRDGFALTDRRYGLRDVLYEVDRCLYCHKTDTDCCAKGMRNKKTGAFKSNSLEIRLTGCPLEEKISEMQLLKRQGDNLGALALVMIDNPMCPGTGHRICNDCMKACIYQKAEPVDIPQVETNVLTEVLFMPFGFEIYGLLSRWNPLNVKRPHALPYNGKNILVVGMGPAGYTLAHYLLNEGFAVVGIDALKIEPLPVALTGETDRQPRPIRDFSELYEELDRRVMAGFGGVAEYGITVRWDKNFLKVIYLTLARRRHFLCYGGVRFGGTLTVDDAWDLGCDHIALATGAGKPAIIDLKNNLTRGIRKASDFLMALQLTGAAKASSLANLQVRMPAGVIGGGLTAIDAATEILAYYPVQVEKILRRYEVLVERCGVEEALEEYDEEERKILDEFLDHGRAVRAERERARNAGESPDFLPLVNAWGGVTIFYRRGLRDAPAYRQNHEEVHKALQEGVAWAEGMSPVEAIADDYRHLRAIKFARMAAENGAWRHTGENVEVPLRTLLVAAGTAPNTIYEHEHPGTFELEDRFFQRFEPTIRDGAPCLQPMSDARWPKIGKPAPFTSYEKHGKHVSFYGDNHPVYAGNVVKAMASARDGYPYIVRLFEQQLKGLDAAEAAQREARFTALKARLDASLVAKVVDVKRLAPSIIELKAHAPLAAKKFQPGQFYRVQNFEVLAPVLEDTVLAAEGLALTGASVDKIGGDISLITLEMGASSRLCGTWKSGDPLVVMGVTGAPTELPRGRNVLMVGGGLGNAVLLSIGQALRAAGNKVIYFAGYKRRRDVFKSTDVEAAADVVVWAVDAAAGVEKIAPARPQDKSFVGNIVEAMLAYAEGRLGEAPILLRDIDHIIAIGSDRMMAAVKEARVGVLQPYLKPGNTAIGSINSPMQCMMKGVCAQCLCKHIDPESGAEYFVYSCYNQDQPLERVDFPNLHQRLRQNSVQEKLTNRLLDYLLDRC